MACRSVNNLRLSKEDMRNIYREQAGGLRCGVKISDLIKLIDLLVPIIRPFFKANANEAKIGNMCGMEGYAGADDKPFHGGRPMKCGSNGIGKSHFGHDHGYMRGAEDYGDRVISEEEFERLLDYAEQCNVKMY